MNMSTSQDSSSFREEEEGPPPVVVSPLPSSLGASPSPRTVNKSAVSNSAPAVLQGNVDDDADMRRDNFVRQNAQRINAGPITVPTPQTELQHVKERHGEHSWQVKAVKFINSPCFQHFLMALLLLDVLILFCEIFIDAAFPHCHIIERDGISCCPADDTPAGEHREEHLRWLASEIFGSKGSDDGHHSVCEPPLVDSGPAGCNSHKYHQVHTAHMVLFSLTIVILSIFEIELMVLLITLGCHLFFSHFLYVLDLFIVTASLVLELTFRLIYDNDLLGELSGVLILLRLWRFVRVGHGLVVTTMEIETEKREKLEERMEEMEHRLKEAGLEVPE